MVINFDLAPFQELVTLPTAVALWRLFFWYFGWLPVAIVMLYGVLQVWLHERRAAWEHHQKFILLAIDVPKNNVQSLMAVENMFTYFAGGHGTFTLIEKWWEGKVQLGFSFEIVSVGGYIQFLVRTPVHFKDLVESAIFSQYPDVEIYEVEDYTALAPKSFPDEEYDIWGSEFIQTAPEMLPIKTWPAFEHDFGEKEVKYRDPMSALMDLMSSLRKGEQLWYQIVVVPTGNEWTAHAQHYIDELLGKSHGASAGNNLVDTILKWMTTVSEMIYKLWEHIDDKHDDKGSEKKFPELPPGPKAKIEAAEMKASKIGFEVSIRAIYLSRKEVMNKPKVVNGFVGYIKQFAANNLNGLKPDGKMTMTSASYFFTKKRILHRKNSIMYGYRHRSDLIGRPPWIMNVEELATLWHFPLDAVTKAPLIQRSAGKRIEPPMSLPIDDQARALSHLEPIFDEGFVVEDESEHDAHESGEAEASREHKQHQSRPAFLDDEEEETSASLAASAKSGADPEFIEKDEGVESHTDDSSGPPPGSRGQAPENLPFA